MAALLLVNCKGTGPPSKKEDQQLRGWVLKAGFTCGFPALSDREVQLAESGKNAKPVPKSLEQAEWLECCASVRF